MKYLILLCSLCLINLSYAQDKIRLEKVVDDLSIPVDISFDHNNQMYVVEKRGKIIRIDNGVKNTFLDISSRVNSGANERGLLGIAFHPNYKTNGFFFLNYINSSGHTNIARFTRSSSDSTIAENNTEKLLMTINQPFNNHNGGCLKFGKDGFLYIAMGDGGSGGDPGNRSQNPKDRLGKMLRIDVNTETEKYLIPDNNPFKENADTLNEIWSLGLRNPWRFSFDKLNGDMWIGDVGQNKNEEVSYEPANSKGGINYGWRCFEGFDKYDYSQCQDGRPYVKPVYSYLTKSNGEGCSITGGYVYRGSEIPYLNGYYVYGDFCTSKIWRLKQNACGKYENEIIYNSLGTQELSTFGEDNNGALYLAALGEGAVYALKQKCSIAITEPLVKDASCDLSNDGSVSFNVNIDTFTYTITGPSLDINKLKPGKYNYTINDNNCIAKGCFEVGNSGHEKCVIGNSEVTICESSQTTVEPSITACAGKMIDSFHLFRNDTFIASSKEFKKLKLDKSGSYSYSYFIGPCSFDMEGKVLLTVMAKKEGPTITFNGSTVKAEGPFISYRMFLDGFSIEENATGIFNIDPEKFGTYTFKGIDFSGCESKFSDELIISDIEDENLSDGVILFPNPFSNEIYIKAENVKLIAIYTLNGTEMLEVRNPVAKLNTSMLATGIYMVKIALSDKQHWIKMVKL
jgi:glucose/arabinose dehydrogenase